LEREDMERFLGYHERDSDIRASLLILGRDQKLGPTLDLAKIAHGTLLSGNGCLLVAPYGEPWRARLFFTASIHQRAPAERLSRVLGEAIADAQTQKAPQEQIHRMAVRLSIGLFQLQSLLNKSAASSPPRPSKVVPAGTTALSEVAPHADNSTLTGASTWLPLGSAAGWSLLGLLASGLGVFSWWRWQKFRLLRYEWLLPTPTTLPVRLGGAHAAGGGCTLTWS
jgi:hypothetical protein